MTGRSNVPQTGQARWPGKVCKLAALTIIRRSTVRIFRLAKILSIANRYGLDDALRMCVDPTWRGKDRETLLSTLIPLNAAADREIAALDAWADAVPAAAE